MDVDADCRWCLPTSPHWEKKSAGLKALVHFAFFLVLRLCNHQHHCGQASACGLWCSSTCFTLACAPGNMGTDLERLELLEEIGKGLVLLLHYVLQASYLSVLRLVFLHDAIHLKVNGLHLSSRQG